MNFELPLFSRRLLREARRVAKNEWGCEGTKNGYKGKKGDEEARIRIRQQVQGRNRSMRRLDGRKRTEEARVERENRKERRGNNRYCSSSNTGGVKKNSSYGERSDGEQWSTFGRTRMEGRREEEESRREGGEGGVVVRFKVQLAVGIESSSTWTLARGVSSTPEAREEDSSSVCG